MVGLFSFIDAPVHLNLYYMISGLNKAFLIPLHFMLILYSV